MPLTFYNLLLYLLVPVAILRLLWRALRNPDYLKRWPERFGFGPRLAGPAPVWLHAVSVGEVRAAVPLIKALRERHPDLPFLVTTMTPTGSAQVRQLFGDQVAHCYVPYDLPGAVRRFLSCTQPRLALVMETELWPNLFQACRRQGVPVVVSNVRMSERSMHRYLRFARLTREVLSHVTLFAAQAEADALRIKRLGAPPERVEVTGSIKFEINLPASLREQAEVLRAGWGTDRPVWIAASTHEGEDELVLAAYRELKPRFPGLLLILVPRHPERFAGVARLCRRQGFELVQRSAQPATLGAEVDILLADTMGELQMLYAAADVAFVGGSLVPTGGHNLLEAAAAGVAAVFGPHMFNFQDIARLTLERGAGVQIGGADELAAAVGDFLSAAERRDRAGEAGRRLVEENRGALAHTLELVAPLIGG